MQEVISLLRIQTKFFRFPNLHIHYPGQTQKKLNPKLKHAPTIPNKNQSEQFMKNFHFLTRFHVNSNIKNWQLIEKTRHKLCVFA